MKIKFILLILCSSIFLVSKSIGQNKPVDRKFVEINAGMASIREIGLFPGASFLFGTTTYYKSGFVWEGEIGFAFPSIVTGKLGVGLGNENVALLLGIRPFPLTGYAQFNITLNQRSSIAFSGEKGNGKDQYLSLGSYGNFNVGYRWAMKKKNRKPLSNTDFKL